MLEEMLRGSWYEKRMIQQGREQERNRMLQLLRLVILDTIEVRFPTLLEPAHYHVNQLYNPAYLRQLNARLVTVQSQEEALHALASCALS